MRVLALLPFMLSAVLARPTEDQNYLNKLTQYADFASTSHFFEGIAHRVKHALHDAGKVAEKKNEKESESESVKEIVEQTKLAYETVYHPSFVEYRLRITEPTLCDPSVKQYSGYLDVSGDKHFFFWFFEARNSPADAPLSMWLNGGPGCSSLTGLLLELGPCIIADEGENTTKNPYSWNTHSNMIFLDQPINVGYSYGNGSVDSSPVAGQDVYAFMELFLNRFPEYADKPFHLAAESYGGTFAPNIANTIYKKNKELAMAPTPKLKKINLASIILANGLTDNYIQLASIPDYLCEGPYPIYDKPNGSECIALRSRVPTCQRLIKTCREFKTKLTCVPAVQYCYKFLYGPVQQSGLNPMDARIKCNRETDGELCYRQLSWIDKWLNIPAHKAELGVEPHRKFEYCNPAVIHSFMMQGDSMHDTAQLLPELINDGIRLLVYAGNADMVCNYIGNERWLEALQHKFSKEFTAAKTEPWVTIESRQRAGTIRWAGGEGNTAGNVTFVTVHEAGHMVPYDQPEAALDLFTRWIMNIPLIEVKG